MSNEVILMSGCRATVLGVWPVCWDGNMTVPPHEDWSRLDTGRASFELRNRLSGGLRVRRCP